MFVQYFQTILELSEVYLLTRTYQEHKLRSDDSTHPRHCVLCNVTNISERENCLKG